MTDPELLDWTKVFFAAIGGGFVVKLLDIAYLELRRRADRQQSAKAFVDQHLDPLLKAADEVVGKVLSLAKEDFTSLGDAPEEEPFSHSDFGSTAYLIAKFWAQIEILRQQALYVSISEDRRGRWLQAFLDCMESRGVRLIDRISQRAVGETLIAAPGVVALRYVDFIRSLENTDTARWLAPLVAVLTNATHRTERQRLLQYAIVMHAMLDTLDPKHSVTRNRPAVPGKISKQTWRDLKYRVFGTYLKFVPSPEKYIGYPRIRTPDTNHR
ncbi:MAG: hypothetical protein ACHP84_02740 [Caulobacterales bacterium]